jgi:hypothetical protein
MQAKIDGLEKVVAGLSATMEANHRQNRGDIHRLFDNQQTIADSIRVGLDHIADKISIRCDGIESDVMDLRLKWARATGYSAAVAGLCALLFELIKLGIDHIR